MYRNTLLIAFVSFLVGCCLVTAIAAASQGRYWVMVLPAVLTVSFAVRLVRELRKLRTTEEMVSKGSIDQGPGGT